MNKVKSRKYYTLPPSTWDSYESKCIRNNTSFEIGLIGESKKQPEKYMVYPITRNLKGNLQVEFHLVEHTLKNIQSIAGYSRYNMECKPLYELELVKSIKDNSYALYTEKQIVRKKTTRKIKPNKMVPTKFIL